MSTDFLERLGGDHAVRKSESSVEFESGTFM